MAGKESSSGAKLSNSSCCRMGTGRLRRRSTDIRFDRIAPHHPVTVEVRGVLADRASHHRRPVRLFRRLRTSWWFRGGCRLALVHGSRWSEHLQQRTIHAPAPVQGGAFVLGLVQLDILFALGAILQRGVEHPVLHSTCPPARLNSRPRDSRPRDSRPRGLTRSMSPSRGLRFARDQAPAFCPARRRTREHADRPRPNGTAPFLKPAGTFQDIPARGTPSRTAPRYDAGGRPRPRPA